MHSVLANLVVETAKYGAHLHCAHSSGDTGDTDPEVWQQCKLSVRVKDS
eukprot:SAG31_NODE_3087_length_4690_cov_30.948377_5_plen_49_part_00